MVGEFEKMILNFDLDLQDSAIATAWKNEPSVAEKAKFAATKELEVKYHG